MDRKILASMAVGCLLLLPVVARGEVSTSMHQATTPPVDSRYEIVQSQLAARWTFKLDRCTGEVAQLVLNADKENTWEKVLVQDLPRVHTPCRPRFQLFTSGIAAKHTFLLDTTTGRTWTLLIDSIPTKDGESDAITFKPFK